MLAAQIAPAGDGHQAFGDLELRGCVLCGLVEQVPLVADACCFGPALSSSKPLAELTDEHVGVDVWREAGSDLQIAGENDQRST